MTQQAASSTRPHAPFDGYHQTAPGASDERLTRVGPGTPCGELLRRFWQPVAKRNDVSNYFRQF